MTYLLGFRSSSVTKVAQDIMASAGLIQHSNLTFQRPVKCSSSGASVGMLMQCIVTIFQRGLVKMWCRTNVGILQQLLKPSVSQQTATAKGQNCWLLSELTALFVSLFNKRPRHYCGVADNSSRSSKPSKADEVKHGCVPYSTEPLSAHRPAHKCEYKINHLDHLLP